MAKRILVMFLTVAMALGLPTTSYATRVKKAKTTKKTTKTAKAKVKSKASAKKVLRPTSGKPTGFKIGKKATTKVKQSKTTKKAKETKSTTAKKTKDSKKSKDAKATKQAKKAKKAASSKKVASSKSTAKATSSKTKKAKTTAKAKSSKTKVKVPKTAKEKLRGFRKFLVKASIGAGVIGAIAAVTLGGPGNPTSLLDIGMVIGTVAGSAYAIMRSIWNRGERKAAEAS